MSTFTGQVDATGLTRGVSGGFAVSLAYCPILQIGINAHALPAFAGSIDIPVLPSLHSGEAIDSTAGRVTLVTAGGFDVKASSIVLQCGINAHALPAFSGNVAMPVSSIIHSGEAIDSTAGRVTLVKASGFTVNGVSFTAISGLISIGTHVCPPTPAIVTTYYLRGWDSAGNFVYWSSVGTPDIAPAVTVPGLVGALGSVCVVGAVTV